MNFSLYTQFIVGSIFAVCAFGAQAGVHLDDFKHVHDSSHMFDLNNVPHSRDMRLSKLHTENVLNAIHLMASDASPLEIRENVAAGNIEGWDLGFLKQEESKGHYNTKTTYTFHRDTLYYSLDHPQMDGTAIRELSNSHLLYCPQKNSGYLPENLAPNSIIVGSSSGSWADQKHIKDYVEYSETHPHEIDQISEVPIFLYRRVLSTNSETRSDGSVCTNIATESIHPLHLFKGMEIESVGDHPFSTAQVPIRTESDKEFATQSGQRPPRRLDDSGDGSGLRSGNGIVPCAESSVWGDPASYSFYGSGANYQFELGYSMGCMSYTYDDQSHSFNYNWDTKAALGTLNLGEGITCTNCFAYLGSGFYTLLSYTFYTFKNNEFRFQAGAYGSTGANGELLVKDMNASGSWTLTLISKAKNYYKIALGTTGLTLSFKFGGLYGDVSASGATTGSVRGSAGAAFSLKAEASYTQGFNTNIGFTYTAPFYSFSNDNFGVKKATVDVDISAVENFQISYGSFISAAFDLRIVQSIQLAYNAGGGVASIAPRLGSTRLLESDGTGTSPTVYKPGDSVSIRFEYFDCNPNAKTVLFYALVPESGIEFDIMKHAFVTSPSGNGVVEVSWIIPWNTEFFGGVSDNVFINVRPSFDMHGVQSTQRFTLEAFTDNDFLISAPLPNSVISTDAALHIEWAPELLSYFARSNDHQGRHGTIKVAPSVVFDLVGETISPEGTLESFIQRIQPDTSSFDNSGSAFVSIPASMVDANHRYYLIVRSSEFFDVAGWSSGYFNFDCPVSAAVSYGQHPAETPSSKVQRHKTTTSTVVLTQGASAISPLGAAPVEDHTSRALGTCSASNPFKVTKNTAVGAKFTGITLIGTFSFGGMSSFASTSFGSNYNCYSFTNLGLTEVMAGAALPTLEPTPRPTFNPVTKWLKGYNAANTNSSRADHTPFALIALFPNDPVEINGCGCMGDQYLRISSDGKLVDASAASDDGYIAQTDDAGAFTDDGFFDDDYYANVKNGGLLVVDDDNLNKCPSNGNVFCSSALLVNSGPDMVVAKVWMGCFLETGCSGQISVTSGGPSFIVEGFEAPQESAPTMRPTAAPTTARPTFPPGSATPGPTNRSPTFAPSKNITPAVPSVAPTAEPNFLVIVSLSQQISTELPASFFLLSVNARKTFSSTVASLLGVKESQLSIDAVNDIVPQTRFMRMRALLAHTGISVMYSISYTYATAPPDVAMTVFNDITAKLSLGSFASTLKSALNEVYEMASPSVPNPVLPSISDVVLTTVYLTPTAPPSSQQAVQSAGATSGISKGGIYGIIGGCAFVLIAAIFYYYYYIHRKRLMIMEAAGNAVLGEQKVVVDSIPPASQSATASAAASVPSAATGIKSATESATKNPILSAI